MAEEVQQESTTSATTEKKSGGKNKLLLLVGAVAVLLILGGGFYYLMNKNSTSTTSESTAPAPTAGGGQVIQAEYTCEDDKTIQATFNNHTDMSADLVLSDGTEVALPLAPSGSGARYANEDESIVFWTQGNTAFLEENGTQTYTDCETEPQS